MSLYMLNIHLSLYLKVFRYVDSMIIGLIFFFFVFCVLGFGEVLGKKSMTEVGVLLWWNSRLCT